jgi:MATE family multidrug resistance protein
MRAPTAIEPFSGFRRETARFARLAAPVVVAQLALVSLATVDTLMAGRLGGEAMAAVALGSTWYFAATVFAIAAARALDPVVSQAHGAGDRRTAGLGLARGIVMLQGLGLLVIVPLLAAEPILRATGQPAELAREAGRYCLLLAPSVPAVMAFSAVRQFLQGLGWMRPGAVAVIATNFVNAALNGVFMFGLGGFPAMGALGCALATTVADWFLLGFLLWISRSVLREYWPGWRGAADAAEQRRLLVLGVPLGLQFALEAWAFHGATLMIGRFGETALAAHAVTFNLAALSFMVPFGLGAAAATRVGNLVGARLPWTRSAWLAVACGAGIMTVPAAAFGWGRNVLARLYTADAEVVALAATLLPLAAAFQMFDGTQAVAFGALRGVGDVAIPSAANVAGYWVVGLPLGAWLAFGRGWGAAGIWTGLAVSLAVVAVVLVARLRWISRPRGALSRAPF